MIHHMLSEYQYIHQCGAAQSFLPLGQPLYHNLKKHIAVYMVKYFIELFVFLLYLVGLNFLFQLSS